MDAQYSIAGGVCIIDRGSNSPPVFVRFDKSLPAVESDAPKWINLVADWQYVRGGTEEEIVRYVDQAFQDHRCSSYFEVCMVGVSNELFGDLVEAIETGLQTRADPDSVLRYLVRAPLAIPHAMEAVRDYALAKGLGATATIANEAIELQPLLRRFVGVWLRTVSDLAAQGVDVAALYLRITQHPRFLDLLHAANRQAITRVFFDLAHADDNLTHRQLCFAASREVGIAFFGDVGRDVHHDTESDQDEDKGTPRRPLPASVALSAHDEYRKSLRQVQAVVEAAAAGHDAKAEQYLEDLLNRQTSQFSTKEFAIKSLCNIAKRCADMFRVDYERRCLESALRLDPNDSWALIQMADHLKRTGHFRDALEVVERAITAGGGDVAISSRADILARRGDFDAAVATYQSIENWAFIPAVRTAIADLHRFRGDLDAAEAEYASIESFGMSSDRVVAGRAEIARRRGELARARALYEGLLHEESLNDYARNVYRSALAVVLKQQGRYLEAYDLAQQLVTELPFNLSAKVLRGSILGLLNREIEGLSDIPTAVRPYAFGEWLRNYTRGLLLLRRREFALARRELIDNLEASEVNDDECAARRLAAALYFIMNDELRDAASLLNVNIRASDSYLEYTHLVLRLHLAVASEGASRIQGLLDSLDDLGYEDPQLANAVVLIRQGRLREAESIELDALLRIAA